MKRRVAASLTAAVWGLFAYIGYDLVTGVIRHHVPGSPTAGQWHYYVHFPLAMLLASVGLLCLARKLPAALFVIVWTLQVLVFVPCFVAYTGGV